MKFWKKLLMLGTVTVFSAGMFAGCGEQSNNAAGPDSGKTYQIGIVQLVEHNALDSARNGFIDGMKERGYNEGQNVIYDRQNAQADQSNLQNIVSRFVNNNDDMILAIATPSAQAAANATKTIPIVGTAITDYTEAKLVDSDEKPGGNVTGTSDMNPISEQIDLLLKLVPEAKTIGVIYSSSEINSEIQVKKMTEYAESKGLTVRTATISTVNDIQQAAQSLVNDVDAFYEPTDNVVASAMPTLAAITDEAKKPIICGEENMVRAGGLATYGIDYYRLGQQTAVIGADILDGKVKPADVSIQTAKYLKLTINKANADVLGITIPEDLAKDAEVVE